MVLACFLGRFLDQLHSLYVVVLES